MASLSIRLLPEEIREIGFAAIGAAYMGVGTAFEHPIRILFLQNLTNAVLMFSFDGITDHVPLPNNGFLLLDVSSNKTTSAGFYIGQGTRIYVKQVGVPTGGSVYLSSFYGKDE